MVCRIHARQFDVAHDGGEDIVEIVGNAPGQGADGLHFLRFTHLRFKRKAGFLGLLALGNIHAGATVADECSGSIM